MKWDDVTLLETLFSDRSRLSDFHFSRLHLACLDRPGEKLEDILSKTPNAAIDVVDNTGRTALSWAAQRGDVAAVSKLLERRASPDKQDASLRTPLHWSVAAEKDDCMRLLLQHDADVEIKDDYFRTALSMVASKKSEPIFLRLLIDFGADTNTEDDEGWQPLHWAAHKDQAAIVRELLHHQANSDATDNLGRNALHLSILRNGHKAMQVLVDEDACGQPGKTALGSTILHSAAYHGDLETLQILWSANLGNIDLAELNNKELTAQMVAQHRRDDNQTWAESRLQSCDEDPVAWYIAFEALIDHITEQRHKKRKSGVDDDWVVVQQGAPGENNSPGDNSRA